MAGRNTPNLASLLLLLLLAGCSSPDDQLPVPATNEFLSNSELAEQNVVLIVQGWQFGGGVTREMGNGFEVVPASWMASGVVVKQDGTFVTNYHVAARALEIEATFDQMAARGGAKYQVPFIKVYDRDNDIAVMQIEGAASFTAARLGDSDSIEPRDAVLAVGNPSGMGLNITEGSISQIRRDQKSGKPVKLTHTAATMGGSSGGSLYKGSEIIGIHHAGIGETEFGFAVPINIVKTLLDDPQYERRLLVKEIFSPSMDDWEDKMEQVDATTANVPATPRQGVNGVWIAKLVLLPQSDYVFFLQTRDDVNLDLMLWYGNTKIGHAHTPRPQYEGLAFSNTGLAPLNVQIEVHSGRRQPMPFGLTVFKITW